MARTDDVARVVGDAAVDGTAGRGVIHQRRAHLRRSQRSERDGRRRRRSLLAAHRRLGADLQRLRACRRVPVSVRRHPSRRRRPARAARSKLEMQQQHARRWRASARRRWCCLAGWLIASSAPLLAIVLWKSYGGTIYAPELVTVVLGHLLNAGLTIALAAAAAAVAEHPSTAAILTLSVTVGTWIVNFIAAVQGGWWERAGRIHADRDGGGISARAVAARCRAGRAVARSAPDWCSRRSGCGSASRSVGECGNRSRSRW